MASRGTAAVKRYRLRTRDGEGTAMPMHEEALHGVLMRVDYPDTVPGIHRPGEVMMV